MAPLLRASCRLFARLVRHRFGIAISPDARLGRRLMIGHQGGIVIGGGVSVGDDCAILQGARIGSVAPSAGARHGAPQIGDRVRIGARAVVQGAVCVGDDARIGPNAVVTSDVEAKVLAMAPTNRVVRPVTAARAPGVPRSAVVSGRNASLPAH
jgi:serine O-acetyltransferase